MMADSLTRWMEGLKFREYQDVTSRSGYPAYEATVLANFYERAGSVKCLGGPERKGSVTIIGITSPQGGDFGEGITPAALNIAQMFWGLDFNLARKRHFPSMNWNISFSKYKLDSYFDKCDPEFSYFTKKLKSILQEAEDLNEIVQLVGRDALVTSQRLTLAIACVIIEDFLQQDIYSAYDNKCPLHKTIGMMRAIITFFDCANKVIEEIELAGDRMISWSYIKTQTKPYLKELANLKFEDPEQNKQEFMLKIDKLCENISQSFKKLSIDYFENY